MYFVTLALDVSQHKIQMMLETTEKITRTENIPCEYIERYNAQTHKNVVKCTVLQCMHECMCRRLQRL